LQGNDASGSTSCRSQIMLTKTTSQMAMVRATVLVRHARDEHRDWENPVGALEHVLDATDVLRRVGSATIQHNTELVDVRCDVEYGPIRASVGDMRRHLERQARAIASATGGRDSAVLNVVPTELITPEQLDEIIENLTTRSNDVAVPLPLRKQLASVVTRLRRGADATRVSRRRPQPAVAT
jgi:hypothetical protein